MGAPDVIYLDHIDGFEFERVCADIFRRAGWGQVEQLPLTGDKGRDLVIRDNAGGTTVVECKHQPGTPVGRPVVQKLHSAVISSKASRGIIVTTGRYTDGAVEHARDISRETRIDLFTLSHLADLADQAGMTLVTGGESPRIFCLSCAGDLEAYGRIRHEVGKLQSYPGKPVEMMRLESHAIVLRPCYLMKADVTENFYTTVRLVHSVDERGVLSIIDGVTGEAAGGDLASAIYGLPAGDSLGIETRADVRREGFSLSMDEARREGMLRLCRHYSRQVDYVGRNNVSYQKYCAVSPRSVRFTDTKQALLPVHVVTIRLARSAYPCKVVGGGVGGGGKTMIDAALGTCAICKQGVRNDPALCNSCGFVYHPRRLFGGHGQRCKNCGKTICNKCTHWITRALFFKKAMCGDCAAPPDPGRAPVKAARPGLPCGKGGVVGTPDVSFSAEWAGGDEREAARRKGARRPRRETARKAVKIAGIAAAVAATVPLAVLIALSTMKRR